MKFISVRDFRAGATALFSTGTDENEYILTNHGKPTALVIPIGEDNFEETLKAVSSARALQALRAAQAQSVKNGTDTMTMKEIDGEIDAYRKEPKKRKR